MWPYTLSYHRVCVKQASARKAARQSSRSGRVRVWIADQRRVARDVAVEIAEIFVRECVCVKVWIGVAVIIIHTKRNSKNEKKKEVEKEPEQTNTCTHAYILVPTL